MAKDESVKVGERVDVYLGKGPVYRTKLEDIDLQGRLVISTPLYRGIPIILHKGQDIEFYFYRANGRYCVDTRVDDYAVEGALRLVMLRPLNQPRRQQRRESYRFKVSLPAILRPRTAGRFPLKPDPDDQELEESLTTRDISATGVALKTKQQFEEGDRFYLRLFLGWPEPDAEPLEFLCDVRQSMLLDPQQKTYQVGAKFLDSTDESRSLITRYVFTQQQKLVKQQKLVESD